MTQILKVHTQNPEKRHIKNACQFIENGKVILIPSETGYCYVGDANKETTQNIFLKLRPHHHKNKPFSLICDSLSTVSQIAQLHTQVYKIAKKILPGPYTLILEANRNTPKLASGTKRKTVGIRISSNPILRELMLEIQKPLLITSITDQEELIAEDYFDKEEQSNSWWTNVDEICSRNIKGLVSLALESDEIVPIHVSTVIDFSEDPPVLIRDGGWNIEFLDF
jgi:tRNA threonylcarbamoyl adenosine modification protein (Sua5/YciO/YrdC/YwlC family)